MKIKILIQKTLCALTLFIIPTISHAYDFEVDGCYYTVISMSERTVRIDSTRITDTLIIPEKIVFSNREFAVVKIKEGAFKNRIMKYAVIPETITEIPSMCFYSSALEEVSLPINLKRIGESAFRYSELKQVNIPAKVTSIGNFAFYECYRLTHIEFEDSGNLSIGRAAFAGGTKPRGKLIFPSIYLSTKRSYESERYDIAFDNCNYIDTLIFKGGFTLTGNAIWGIDNIIPGSDFYKPNGLPYNYIFYGGAVSGGFPLFISPHLYRVEPLPSRVIEFDYTSIGLYDKIYDGDYLEKVIFGENTYHIEFPFSNAKKLNTIYLKVKTPPSTREFSFKQYYNTKVYVPRGTLKAYQEADVWKEFWNIEEYDVTDNPTAIETVKTSENDEIIGIYDINGIKHTSPVKGLNIYKYKDGRVIKRIMK
ncbi:MAG: leucine-rich repeat domain-containing protein [Prevotella sp.]|nr:leucine-rich repeat domain-containing protein [Prevotella sp.]